jgi:hypothetical protein
MLTPEGSMTAEDAGGHHREMLNALTDCVNYKALLRSLVFGLITMLVLGTQAFAASAHIWNPMSLSNTTASTYPGHPVYYFSGWTNRFAHDLNSPDEYPNASIWGWGTGWTTANVLTGSNQPIAWTVWANNTGPCLVVGTEYAMAFALNLPNGQTAGFSVSHLSNYHYAAGAQFSQGAQIANLSWLSAGRNTYQNSGCSTLNSTGPHIHAESARTGSTTFNAIDPISGPSNYPYWYYNY